METEFKPNYAVHVGIPLKEALEAYSMKQCELAERIGVSKTVINEIIKGKRGMSKSVAIALENIFGVPAKYWLDIQRDYELFSVKKGIVLIHENEEIETADYQALEIAHWFINRNEGTEWGDFITPLKLQKLLFFTQAVFLKERNKAAFVDPILHWELGPVVKPVYREYKNKERSPLVNAPKTNLDNATVQLLECVYKTYGIYTASYLVELTHREEAWLQTKKDEVIPLNLIKQTFVGI